MLAIVTFLFFFLLGLLIFKKINIEIFVFLFIFLLPMRGLSPEQSGLMGRISADNIATAILLLYLLASRKKQAIKFKQLDYSKRTGFLIMVIFLLGVHYFVKIKALIIVNATAFGTPPESIKIYQILRDAMIILTFFLLSERLYNHKVLLAIHKAVLFGGIILSISIIFPGLVQRFGLVGGFSVSGRQSGILNVNPNIAGSYCAIIVGYILALFGDKKNDFHSFHKIGLIIIGVLIFIAVLYTGSRQALITIMILFFFFFYVNKNSLFRNINSLYVVLLICLFFLFYHNYGQMIQERVSESFETGGGSFQTRIEHWVVYIKDLINNPDYLFIGNSKPLPFGYRYDAHNYYVFLLWNTGIFTFGLLIFWLVKLYKESIINVTNYLSFDIRFILVAYMLTSFMNSYVLNYTFVALILISAGIPLQFFNNLMKYNPTDYPVKNLKIYKGFF